MAEIRQQLRSLSDWQDLRADSGLTESVRSAVLAAVRERGYVEPITGVRRHPYQIAIRERDLHETISCCGLNGRKRALLAQIEMELHSRQMFSPGTLRLLGTDAMARLGLVLRGIFPLHVAAELAAADGRNGVRISMPSLPSLELSFADAAFDVFVSGESFNTAAEFKTALPDILRLLAPGGLIIAYLPFVTAADNPGSAAWEILDSLRLSGCSDAYFTTIASSFFGITSEGRPGPFILTAQKAGAAGPQAMPPPAVMELGDLPEKLCVLLALPRSGTTLVTSMFAVHSQFVASYEPWNSKVLDTAPDADPRISTLIARDRIGSVAGKTLFVKETAVDSDYIRAVRRLYEHAPYPVERHSIFLLRDLDHTLLSEVDRRNEWWNDNVTLNRDFIGTWARNRGTTLWQIVEFALSANSLVVAFEEVAARPEQVMRELADRIGFHFEREQLEYEKHMGAQRPRGDLNVSRSPEKIDLGRATARHDKIGALKAMIAGTAAASWFEACRALHAHVIGRGGIVPAADIPKDILEALRPSRPAAASG